ncbi:hypothetical protein EMPG_11011 [Blastomyces silverae]|uniref:Uncharacterized protein n=1 Tax=Blastomyces silverae TaxID=2060906 RepID=A0A0H1B8C0_9EURO|nr:hypothetical protein EMPG_11011 [Blastomyces silverae]
MQSLLSRLPRGLRLNNKTVDKLAPSATKLHHNEACSAFGTDQQRRITSDRDLPTAYYYEKPLTASQFREIRIGRFPANIHEDGIRFKSSWEAYSTLLPPYGKKSLLPELRISYDAGFSTTSVERAPTSIHELCASHLSHKLHGRFPLHLQSSLEFEVNYRIPIRKGDKLSERKPDIAISHTAPDGKSNLVGVAEVGFSQPYADLKRWRDVWFEGVPTINVVILINLLEKPRFPRKEALEYIQKQGQQNFPEIDAIKEDDFILQNPTDATSARTAYGFIWCGTVQGTLEIWTRCPETGRPMLRSKPNCFYGPNVDGEPNIKIQPGDLVPSFENETYEEVELDAIALQKAIEKGRKRTAKERFVKLLKVARGVKEIQRRYSA